MTEKKSPFVVWRTDEQIRIRVRELGQRIQKDFNGAEPYVMGVLRGAFIFMADLVRAMDLPVHCQFINMYYKDSALHENIVKEIEETQIYPAHPLAGKNVLLVATVLDTGIIMDHLLGHIREQGVQSVRIVTLIDKPFMRRVDLKADYAAFESQDAEFIFGYGLDYQEKYRNLPFLAKFR
jgi:hypoxanthine phosphoribosyltransferase